ncbi:hypothetical protein VNO78_11023 [Psophocarpus tetragonolobus]|uniref:Uncharacterized protein n=1 Tax=Psophocarpus tetragonolobus TaxID=3891 RepID=A0AAN9SKR4_PSOTE
MLTIPCHKPKNTSSFPSKYDIPIMFGYALLTLEALMVNPSIKRDDNEWVNKIYQLLDKMDNCIPIPHSQTNISFFLKLVQRPLIAAPPPLAVVEIPTVKEEDGSEEGLRNGGAEGQRAQA